ncbi:MAG: hypothetical protein GXO74_15415 [Calditrichaeota bacterium]|nr:hypothetical protein [Calditrichota bacterium]
MRKYFFFCMSLLLIVASCASNRYLTADKYLQQEKYDLALKEYIRLAEAQASFNLSKDVPALTGAMIAYYGLGKYKKSFDLSKRILSLDTYNSAAIFYAGLNLEQKEKFSLAKRIYRYYQFLSSSDPYYDLIKARFNFMVEKEMEARAKMALQLEKSVGMGQVVDNTLAVLYFANLAEDPRWDAVSKGLAEMLITDFTQVKKLRVIERVQLQKLLDEMELAMSGLADPKIAPRMGRLVRAKDLVHGGFLIKAGRFLTVNSDIVDVAQSKSIASRQFKGELKDILNIEKKIVFNTLDKLNIKLSSAERKRIQENTTKSIDAFLEFCKGLDAYDLGNYDAAVNHFKAALRFDSRFRLARNMANQSFSMGFIRKGKFMAQHPMIKRHQLRRLGTRPRRFANKPRAQRFAQFRLRQMARNLDLGYLPGNQSRNGNSELLQDDVVQNLPDWIINKQILPLPPKPPEVHNPNTP